MKPKTLVVILALFSSLFFGAINIDQAINDGITFLRNNQESNGTWFYDDVLVSHEIIESLVSAFGAERVKDMASKFAEYVSKNIEVQTAFLSYDYLFKLDDLDLLSEYMSLNLAYKILGKPNLKFELKINRLILRKESEILSMEDLDFIQVLRFLAVGKFALTPGITKRALSMLEKEENVKRLECCYYLLKYGYPVSEETINSIAEYMKSKLEKYKEEKGTISEGKLTQLALGAIILSLGESDNSITKEIIDFLLSKQNKDGSWGNSEEIATTFMTTALVLEALGYY
ncbi:hypothetical protein AT15_05875 [Kosmotoga arenicorallina S304]|uniref:Squalene cyclase C-terminal domain-containing protein n=1 Tax=Kosmotoga arenicorallina S304 TaxID=1453497 RepID=A0A176K2S7_9BACT|nr:prenyltransferase/squalene oxidase repeat-containing protein [Kosmotoga arenicorallina]OAA31600.1 hypothetical protein AT15_05875 [Kosmotoga arenicorallina S304]